MVGCFPAATVSIHVLAFLPRVVGHRYGVVIGGPARRSSKSEGGGELVVLVGLVLDISLRPFYGYSVKLPQKAIQ